MNIVTSRKILHEMSNDVDKVDERFIRELVREVRNRKCIALSAIQLGRGDRIFAMKYDNEILVFVNPEIIYRCGNRKSRETCLSLPGKRFVVKRSRFVKVAATTPDGCSFVFNATNVYAACVEHEIDHLNGLTLEDKKEWKS